jgi:endogenous inhibitor of DNA gyrase (YacG/DUF329 family)
MNDDTEGGISFEPLVRTLWPTSRPLPISVLCPICGAPCKVWADESWSQDAGDWIAEEVRIECTSEPGTETSDLDNCMDFDEWFNWHYRMPYVDWLPLEINVLREVQKRFRFDP